MQLFNLDQYSILPFLSGLAIIIIGYMKLWKIRKSSNPQKIHLFEIWLAGIVAFLFGYFGQLLAARAAFEAVAEAGDLSPSFVAGNIQTSFTSNIIGLASLIISLIIWGILKSVKINKLD